MAHQLVLTVENLEERFDEAAGTFRHFEETSTQVVLALASCRFRAFGFFPLFSPLVSRLFIWQLKLTSGPRELWACTRI